MKKIIIFLLVITMLLPVVAACTDKAAEKVKVINVFKSESISLPDGFSASGKMAYVDGRILIQGYVYDEYYNYKQVIYSVNEDGSDGKEILLMDNTREENYNAYINTAIFSPAGNIMYTLVKWSYNEETYESSNESYFIVLDKDGKQLSFMDLNKMFAYKENFWGVYNFLMDSKNNLYFVIENAVVVTDVNGTVLFEVSVGSDRYINNIYLDKNGDVLVLYYDYSNDSYRNILKKIDLNKRDLGDEVSLPSRVENYVYNLMPSNDPVYDFYFNDSSVLCAVDLKSGSVVEILNWINSDIDSNSMYNFVVINADKVICSGYDYNYDKSEMLVLTRIPDDQIVEKYLLTLACVYLDWEIRTAIIKFNRNSDEYRIQIHDYSQYNTNDDKGWENGINKLNMDLISGNIPDLIMLDSRMPLDSYAAKGIFMDLYKYMDSDPNFRREDYFTNVFKAMEYNGKLFRLTPGFNIQTVVAKTSLVGNKTGWTIDEFNALMNSLPPMALAFEDATQSGMLNKYCSMMIDEFIDKDTGRCYFDSEGFIKVLEYVKTLDTKGFWETINWEDIDDSFWQDRETAYRDNRTVLIDYWFDNFDQYWRTMKGQFGEDITFIGMPTESRNGSAIYSFVELAMSARTKSPDGAWQFLSYFLSDEYQNSRGWGIPMKISRFEQMAKEAMEPDWGELYPEDGYDTPGITVPKPMPARPVVTTEVAVEEVDLDGDGIIDSPSAPAPAYYWEPTYWIGNQEIKIGWITQEYVDRVMDFVKSVDRIVRNDQTMMEIINEEAGAFFAGQKSARETANIIQNRIQNYVSERR